MLFEEPVLSRFEIAKDPDGEGILDEGGEHAGHAIHGVVRDEDGARAGAFLEGDGKDGLRSLPDLRAGEIRCGDPADVHQFAMGDRLVPALTDQMIDDFLDGDGTCDLGPHEALLVVDHVGDGHGGRKPGPGKSAEQ